MSKDNRGTAAYSRYSTAVPAPSSQIHHGAQQVQYSIPAGSNYSVRLISGLHIDLMFSRQRFMSSLKALRLFPVRILCIKDPERLKEQVFRQAVPARR